MQANLKALFQGRLEGAPPPPPKRAVGRPKGVRPPMPAIVDEAVAAEMRALKRQKLAELREELQALAAKQHSEEPLHLAEGEAEERGVEAEEGGVEAE